MVKKFIYPIAYLAIAMIVYFAGALLGDDVQHKKLIQIALFFGLAIIADRLLKIYLSRKGKDTPET